jgi:phosphopentomutase
MTLMQRFYLSQISVSPANVFTAKQFAEAQANTLNGILEPVVMTIPVLIAIGILAYRKRRAAVLQQRVLQLERLWLLNSARRSQ